MTAFLIGLGIGFVLGGVGGVLIAAYLFGSTNQGRAEEQARQATATVKATSEAMETRNEVDVDVARAGNARDRLRADWRE